MMKPISKNKLNNKSIKLIPMKTRKWYSTNIKPDRRINLIIMTDMGYVFEAIYENDKFLVSILRNGKVYFEEEVHQECITKWMKF